MEITIGPSESCSGHPLFDRTPCRINGRLLGFLYRGGAVRSEDWAKLSGLYELRRVDQGGYAKSSDGKSLDEKGINTSGTTLITARCMGCNQPLYSKLLDSADDQPAAWTEMARIIAKHRERCKYYHGRVLWLQTSIRSINRR